MNNFADLQKIFSRELKDHETLGILGFGREGRSTFAMLRKFNPEVKIIIADKNPASVAMIEPVNDPATEILCGEQYLEILNMVQVVFVSPGISLIHNEIPHSVKLTSQTDFVFRLFGDKITAITGTKGKSTTASLIAHILRKRFQNLPLAGNIGIPPFDVIENLQNTDAAVFEISSHQLQ